MFKKLTGHGQPNWQNEKKKILTMPLEEKRKLYKSSDYVPLNSVETWTEYESKHPELSEKKSTLDDVAMYNQCKFDPGLDKSVCQQISIYEGDITKLEVDAIVNAANSALRAGGGVDGAIHRAAGPLLQQECNSLEGCQRGDAKITGGYNLPASYIIHTVGPQDGSASALRSCYEKSLAFHSEHRLTSIAFPCISTGIYGFPNRLAAHIALKTARTFLEKNEDMRRIIFCTFMPIDIEIYQTLLQLYFPIHKRSYNDGATVSE